MNQHLITLLTLASLYMSPLANAQNGQNDIKQNPLKHSDSASTPVLIHSIQKKCRGKVKLVNVDFTKAQGSQTDIITTVDSTKPQQGWQPQFTIKNKTNCSVKQIDLIYEVRQNRNVSDRNNISATVALKPGQAEILKGEVFDSKGRRRPRMRRYKIVWKH